jgi:hypothetical protein
MATLASVRVFPASGFLRLQFGMLVGERYVPYSGRPQRNSVTRLQSATVLATYVVPCFKFSYLVRHWHANNGGRVGVESGTHLDRLSSVSVSQILDLKASIRVPMIGTPQILECPITDTHSLHNVSPSLTVIKLASDHHHRSLAACESESGGCARRVAVTDCNDASLPPAAMVL